MPLFGQREHLRRLQLFGVPGLAEVATEQGWQPGTGLPLDGLLEADVREIALAMYGGPGGPLGSDPGAEPISFTDAYRGRLDDRGVIIANAWVGVPSQDGLPGTEGVSVCAVELAAPVGLLSVQPRAWPAGVSLPETPAGHPAFDARFAVHAAAEPPRASLFQRAPARPPAADARLAGELLTGEVRQLMLARDDWAFRARRTLLCCVGRGPFPAPAEVGDRITEALAIALAIPAVIAQPVPDEPAGMGGAGLAGGDPYAAAPPGQPALAGTAGGWLSGGPADATLVLPVLPAGPVLPAPVSRVLTAPAADRSAAELTAALGGLASIDEALSMLAGLTPGEHETLAGLDTPLAALAGAHSAQEATARYRALDPQRKLQLAARFMSARDARARRQPGRLRQPRS